MSIETSVAGNFLDYRIEEPIGQGGMGVVFLANDLRLKRKVALKLMAPELALDERFRERFARESELAMSLEHPNVVPIHDAGEADGRLYLAMRFVDGTDLRALLRDEGPLEPSRTLAIVRQVAQALDAAHAKGLVHRDVKPSNVLLDPSEHVYLADFGLTRRQSDDGTQPGDGRSLGTPAYLAPEQIDGGPIDGRADVYSLGCLLYECLTGEPPFPAVSRLEVAWAHLEEDPPQASERNPELPNEIDAVIRKAMAKQPADRYATCAELVAAAEAAVEREKSIERDRGLGRRPTIEVDRVETDAPRSGLPLRIRALPLPTGDEPPRFGRRKVAALVAGVVLLAAVGVGALAVTASDQRPLEILPTSLVRLDPETLEPSQVVRIGPRADLVAVAGGYVWITHGLLRYADDDYLRDAGDRTLTRVDPSTGEARVVGGGLAPCGIAADPSGDVWVANCFASATGANVVRVDARTLEFEATWPVPAGDGYYRGMAYGRGALWVADASGAGDHRRLNVTQLNPRTGARRSIPLVRHASALAWSERHGDLWITNFADRSVTRLHAATEESKRFDSVARNPGALVVEGNAVWVGDWNAPAVLRLPAVGTGRAGRISLPMTVRPGGITSVAAGAGGIWAAVPDDRAVWRIDPKTNRPTRIALQYHPWGVAVGDEAVWAVLRARNE